MAQAKQKMPEADQSKAETLDPDSASFRLSDYPFYRLNRLSGRYASVMNSVLKQVSLDQPRWRVVMILGAEGTCSVSRIAELAIMQLSTITRIVQRMQRDGLVDLIRRASDNRVTEVSLTEHGEAVHDKVRSVASRVFRQAVSDLSREELLLFNRLLETMHDSLAKSPYER